jgi:hypothetical protein
MGSSLSYSRYTVERSCFVKRFPKIVPDSSENLLHQHSHSRSWHSCSHSSTKRTLSYPFNSSLIIEEYTIPVTNPL